MGSSINCIIPKEENYSIEKIKQKLNNVFSRLKLELLHLKKIFRFSRKCRRELVSNSNSGRIKRT